MAHVNDQWYHIKKSILLRQNRFVPFGPVSRRRTFPWLRAKHKRAQKSEMIDGMNAAALLGEDKLENGWQLPCPVSSGWRYCLLQEFSSAAVSNWLEKEFAMEHDRVSQLTLGT